jgi:uncharacterized membrane protein
MTWALLLLGFLGAINGSAADVLCVKAAQSPQHPWWMVPLASLMLSMSAPLWYVMSRMSGGKYVEPAIAWTIASTFTVIVAVTICDGHQSPRQWLGFALILVGALVRG